MAAIVKFYGWVHRRYLMFEWRREMLTAIDVLHGFSGGLFVLAGVVGNAAIAEFGGGHGGIRKEWALTGCRGR